GLNVIVSLGAASAITCRREPGPLSFVFVTIGRVVVAVGVGVSVGVSVGVADGVALGVGVSVGVFVAVGSAVGVPVGVGGLEPNSKAPMSNCAPCGRGAPRWSVSTNPVG